MQLETQTRYQGPLLPISTHFCKPQRLRSPFPLCQHNNLAKRLFPRRDAQRKYKLTRAFPGTISVSSQKKTFGQLSRVLANSSFPARKIANFLSSCETLVAESVGRFEAENGNVTHGPVPDPAEKHRQGHVRPRETQEGTYQGKQAIVFA